MSDFKTINERLRDLDDYFKSRGWEYHIAYKDEPWPTRKLRIYKFFLDIFLSIFMLKKKFYQSYATVFDHYIMLPTREFYERNSYRKYRLIRHELVHIKQRNENPFWFKFSYLFVLPFFFTYRYKWELEAYTETMIAEYQYFGVVRFQTIKWLEEVMTSRMYFWMTYSKKKARRDLLEIKQGIESGEIKSVFNTE